MGNVLQYFEREYKKEFADILRRLAKAIPRLNKITPDISQDKRLLLRFDETGYVDLAYATNVIKSQSWAHVMLIFGAVLGNIGFWARRAVKARESE